MIEIEIDDIGQERPLTFAGAKGTHIGKLKIIDDLINVDFDILIKSRFYLDVGCPKVELQEELQFVLSRRFFLCQCGQCGGERHQNDDCQKEKTLCRSVVPVQATTHCAR